MKYTSKETTQTLAVMAKESFSNYDSMSADDQFSSRALMAENIKLFIKSWVASIEIKKHFDWNDTPIEIVKQSFTKLIEDIDREYNV